MLRRLRASLFLSSSLPSRALTPEDSFYDGAPIEKDILNRAYLRLIKHVNSIFKVCLLTPSSPPLVLTLPPAR